MKDINFIQAQNSIFLKKISKKADISLKDTCDGYLINSSESEARKIIESLKGRGIKKIIALEGKDDAFNRRALETLKINYLVSPEANTANDTLKQRDSGLNHVTAKIASKKGITILINFSEISSLSGKLSSLRLAKIIQNIKIARKANLKIKIASFAANKKNTADEKSRTAFGVSLGMSSIQGKDSTNF